MPTRIFLVEMHKNKNDQLYTIEKVMLKKRKKEKRKDAKFPEGILRVADECQFISMIKNKVTGIHFIHVKYKQDIQELHV